MLSSNSTDAVQAQAQASAATPTFANLPVQSTTSSLLQGLQERAHAGWQATTQIVIEQTNHIHQAANERMQTARAGKKLLDEGGEIAAEAVVAKKASLDASEIDRSIANRVHVAIIKLDDSVSKLRMAHSADSEAGDIDDLSKIAVEHEARAATLREVAHMLETPASAAEMSPEEFDALAIVQARAGYATVLSRTSARLESVKQKTLASIPSASTAPTDDSARAPELSAASAPTPTLLQGLKENALASWEDVKQAANDRVNTARAGKRLLDEGGDAVAHRVVAKRATLEAVDIDRNVAQRVQTAILRFDESASKLRALSSDQDVDAITNLSMGNRVQLAEEHELRANAYRKIADMLAAPIASVSMNLAEWDALKLVKVRDGCGVLQCRTNEGFEAVKSLAFSSCSSEVGDEDGRRRRPVCA